MLRGGREYERYKKGETLSHKQAILAQCFVCNGLEEGGEDCLGKSCPLYQFMPYGSGRRKKPMSEARKRALSENLKAAMSKRGKLVA